MPYRAMFTTLITVAIALLAVGMRARAVAPMFEAAGAATQPMPGMPVTAPATLHADVGHPDRALKLIVRGTLLLSFLLICLLLIVGFFATFREWVRFSALPRRQRVTKTSYTDAWKLAGERLNPDQPPPSPRPPTPPSSDAGPPAT